MPVIKKLVHLHNKEANVKTFIATLANNYSDKINDALEQNIKKKAHQILSKETKKDEDVKTNFEKMKELAVTTKRTSRALFSDDTARNVLNHKAKYKIEDDE